MIGTTKLHYRIEAKIGEGGMGVVYKATDTRLKRTVAIKFLPGHIAANREDRERFEIEAQAAAALNHPNIATIHAIEESEDEIFLVMEYIDGDDLSDLLAGSPLSIDTVLNYATQIAEGLQAAHENGVTHRDIKSANLMVTDKGQVKIMDFGLAKMRGGAKVTKVGTTVGTAAYMSPEQARGEETDHRADIWSFGVVLYEMLTGKAPFGADYEQAVIYSILNESPKPLDAEISGSYPNLQHILDKSLDKERNSRYQSAGELLSDLRSPSEPETVVMPAATATPVPGGGRKKARPIAMAGVALIVIAAMVAYWNLDQGQSTIRLTNPRKITTAIDIEHDPTWSPDGSKIAYAGRSTRKMDVWVKQVDGGEPINLTHDVGSWSRYPSWSPDGSQIAFRGGRTIRVMPAIGGAAKTLSEAHRRSNPVWSSDGTQLAFLGARDSEELHAAQLLTISDYQTREVILPGERFERLYLSWSWNKRFLAYADADNEYHLADHSDINILAIEDGAVHQIPSAGVLDFFHSGPVMIGVSTFFRIAEGRRTCGK